MDIQEISLNQVLTAEQAQQVAEKKKKEEIDLAQVALSASLLQQGADTLGKMNKQASLGVDATYQGRVSTSGAANSSSSPANDPWANFPWPNDPNSDDPSFNFNTGVNGEPIIDPYGNDGVLQRLYQMLYDLKNFNNDPMLLPQLIEFIANIGANSSLANDPDIQAFFQGLNFESSNGHTIGYFLIDTIIMQKWGLDIANGMTPAQANADTQTLLTQLSSTFSALGLTASNPIAGDMVSEVAYLQQNLGNLTNQFMINGRLAYINSAGEVIYCDNQAGGLGQLGWMDFIGGNMALVINGGQVWVGPPGTGKDVNVDGSNLGSQLSALFKMMFSKESKQITDPSLLLIYLFMMLGLGQDDNYQSDLGGLGNSTKWMTKETQEVAKLIADFNGGQFSPSNNPDGQKNAIEWMQDLKNLFTQADNNQGNIDPTFLSTIKSIWQSVEGTSLPSGVQPIAGYPSTLGGLFQAALDGKDPNDELGSALSTLASSSGSAGGGGSTVLDNLNTASKMYTDRSQTISTQTSAVANEDNQIVNTLNTALNDSSSGIAAQENAAVKLQITN